MIMPILTRLKARPFRIMGLVLVCVAFAVLALINQGKAGQTLTANGPTVEERFGLQGNHHRIGLELVNGAGKHFVIDDIVVGTDRIAIRYHATGISPVPPEERLQNALYKTEPPTLIKVTADGVDLRPFGATVGGQRGASSIHGEYVARFSGVPPHHLHIAVLRLEGDLGATFNTDVDL